MGEGKGNPNYEGCFEDKWKNLNIGILYQFKIFGMCASGIVVMGQNVLVLGRCMLKYLGMKNQDVSNLFSTGLGG